MKFCLVAVALALFCAVHGFSDDLQAQEKARGQWMALGISTTDPHILKHMDKMKTLAVDVSFEGGDVVIETRIPTPQGCKTIKMVFKKGDDGKYYHKCRFGEKKVEVVETDGNNYAIVDLITSRKDQTYRTSSLYARNAESQPIGLLERFQQRSEEKGYTSEQIKIFPTEVACQNEAE